MLNSMASKTNDPFASKANQTHETLQAFGRQLRFQRYARNLTLDQLAAATGISKPYLSNIETARLTGPPSADKLSLLEQTLALPAGSLVAQADWLRTPPSVRALFSGPDAAGKYSVDNSLPRRSDGAVDLDQLFQAARQATNRLDDKNNPRHVDPQAYDPGRQPRPIGLSPFIPLSRIPLINRVAAGNAAEFTDLDYPVGIADRYVSAPCPPAPPADSLAAGEADANMFALRIEGDSMEPLYHQGDIVVFSSTQPPRDGDDCLVRLDDAENFSTTFKRVEFATENNDSNADAPYLTLVPLNVAYARRSCRRGQITGLYPALWRITPANARANSDSAMEHATTTPAGTPKANAADSRNPPAKQRRRRRKGPIPIESSFPTASRGDTPIASDALSSGQETDRFSLEND